MGPTLKESVTKIEDSIVDEYSKKVSLGHRDENQVVFNLDEKFKNMDKKSERNRDAEKEPSKL